MRFRLALALCLGFAAIGPADDPKPAEKPKKYEIPYRLTDTNHILVRAKLNGKGPFNLILDTGAPAVFITKDVAKRAKLEVGDNGWGAFDSFEVEGGLKVDKVKTRVEDLIQIDGMNKMGLAGVELHGVIGYNVLARFRVEYDFTADKLGFESIPGFAPPDPEKIEAKGADDIQSMAGFFKAIIAMSGLKPNFDVVPRGFVGIEVAEGKDGVVVKKVLARSPAEKAGLKAGDVIASVKEAKVASGKELSAALAKAGVGTKWVFTVRRGDKTEEITVELGRGL